MNLKQVINNFKIHRNDPFLLFYIIDIKGLLRRLLWKKQIIPITIYPCALFVPKMLAAPPKTPSILVPSVWAVIWGINMPRQMIRSTQAAAHPISMIRCLRFFSFFSYFQCSFTNQFHPFLFCSHFHSPYFTFTFTFLYTPLFASTYILQVPLPFALITPALLTVATLLLVV